MGTTRPRIDLTDIYPAPKFAAVSRATAGALVALVASKRIRVLAYHLTFEEDTVITFTSGTGGGISNLTGAMTMTGIGGFGAQLPGPFSMAGHFQTVAGEALGITLSVDTQVSGYLVYVEV